MAFLLHLYNVLVLICIYKNEASCLALDDLIFCPLTVRANWDNLIMFSVNIHYDTSEIYRPKPKVYSGWQRRFYESVFALSSISLSFLRLMLLREVCLYITFLANIIFLLSEIYSYFYDVDHTVISYLFDFITK